MDSPTDVTKPGWSYLLRRSAAEFSRDQLTDKAAALTYYGVLSIFPALIALVSILGLLGQGQSTTNALIDTMSDVVPPETAEQLRGPIASITETSGAGLGLIIGLLTAIWTASNYVNAFSRAMNGIYGVAEGRPFWKLRPIMYAFTALLIVLVAAAALMLVVSGPIARTIGDLVGLGETALMVWNIAKWPVLVLIAIIIIALLYYVTPNVQLPKFRWMSPGAIVALVVAALATAGLGLYISLMGGESYNQTYGSLAGVIIFLLWLWIMNLILLFGAELDAELQRVRQLQMGIAAEEDIQLPARDTTKIDKDRRKYEEQVAEARELRAEAVEDAADDDAADDDAADDDSAGDSGRGNPAGDGKTSRG
ncbi:MAG TPA: YihY/virulence factor BrkB family protein [Actinomycetaceae bacterium]|nr:YihY/virulence factor BrkB family protein [Actinomycetaceae bacterium]